jgi:UDP-2-acetamido-3-amino-2,3-dideoxy-glucuronate N-acetyltransferase
MPDFDPARHPGVQIHPSVYIDEPCEIGPGTRIWHFSHIMAESRIGRNCNLGQNVVVAPRALIGNNVKIQNNVSIYEGVELEDGVFCGPSMVFTNVLTPRAAFPRNTADDYVRTVVRRGASLGANSTIVCGVTIGECALVGAGAVITRDVPAYAIMVGVPARQRGWACACGLTLEVEKDRATCKCSRRYRLESPERLAPVS